MSKPRIVIVGGGFGGVKCAQTLRRRLKPQDCEIVLFDSQNHLVFYPLLAEVAGGLIHGDSAAVPLRQMIPTIQCRRESVRTIDFKRRLVVYGKDAETTGALPYDHVVVACGRVDDLMRVPGMADHAFPLKKIGDAVLLRAKIIQRLEDADLEGDADRRRRLLSFVIVGGGFSGVEIAGEINDLARESLRYYPRVRSSDIRVTLLHSHEQILPEVEPPLRLFARRKMEEAGIRFVLGARAVAVTLGGVRLADGSSLPGGTVVATIGSAPAPLVMELDAEKDRGSLVTEPDLRLKGKATAWAVGDCARIVNGFDGKPSPPTGQFAERQGRQAAENIIRALAGHPPRPFSHKSLGQLCAIGGRRAVADVAGLRLSGFLAWFVWRGVYLFKMPTWSRRVRVGLEWAWDLLFGRDLSSITPDLTERLSHAYYNAGDEILRQGEAVHNAYAIEAGEVELLQRGPEGDRVGAVMAAGDFFGTAALLENKPCRATVRARTAVRLLVMGRDMLAQLSESFAPLKQLLRESAARYESDALRRFPRLQEDLRRGAMESFIEPDSPAPLRPDQTLSEALAAFSHGRLHYIAVVDHGKRLTGVMTLSDLFVAVSRGASAGSPVRDLMTRQPAYVELSDSPELAASLLRARWLKWVPVVESSKDRRFVGWVSAQLLLERAIGARSEGISP